MMDEDYSSDTSDDDYNPNVAESECDEESSDSGGDLSDEGEPTGESHTKVGRKHSKKHTGKKKQAGAKTKLDAKTVDDEIPNLEGDKERAENLWSSFKKEVEIPVKPTQHPCDSTKPTPKVETAASMVVKTYEFAGEKVSVTEQEQPTPTTSSKPTNLKRPLPIRTGGLSGFASQLSAKKVKLSTLEKSKLDWDTFKKDEGIEEDLKSFNQGKKGYLERQAFLERADVKQFEIEKGFRASRKN